MMERKPANATPAEQLTLFAGAAPVSRSASRRASTGYRGANPHLAAAQKLSRGIRRLKRRSDEETQAGLAICAQLKAYLEDDAPDPGALGDQPPH